MFGEIESFERSCDPDIVSAMEKAMRRDITPDITMKVMSIDPQVIDLKVNEILKNLAQSAREDSEHGSVWDINSFFINWTSRLPDKNYGENISRQRQGNVIMGNLEETKSFHATIYACIFASNLDLGRILELNDENVPGKNERHASLAKYTVPVIARLLALGYSFKDLTQ